jgi:hypothetical protein
MTTEHILSIILTAILLKMLTFEEQKPYLFNGDAPVKKRTNNMNIAICQTSN